MVYSTTIKKIFEEMKKKGIEPVYESNMITVFPQRKKGDPGYLIIYTMGQWKEWSEWCSYEKYHSKPKLMNRKRLFEEIIPESGKKFEEVFPMPISEETRVCLGQTLAKEDGEIVAERVCGHDYVSIHDASKGDICRVMDYDKPGYTYLLCLGKEEE